MLLNNYLVYLCAQTSEETYNIEFLYDHNLKFWILISPQTSKVFWKSDWGNELKWLDKNKYISKIFLKEKKRKETTKQTGSSKNDASHSSSGLSSETCKKEELVRCRQIMNKIDTSSLWRTSDRQRLDSYHANGKCSNRSKTNKRVHIGRSLSKCSQTIKKQVWHRISSIVKWINWSSEELLTSQQFVPQKKKL